MFEGRQDQDVITVTLKTGESHTGSYMTQAGMHFVATKGDRNNLIGKVEGPFFAAEIVSVAVVTTREEVLEERRGRSLGAPLPGREPVTRDDFEYRLERLARAVVSAEGQRRTQLSRQFHELADRVALAKSKRTWMLYAARWSMQSNEAPTLLDLWGSEVASPSLLRRPSPKDFDPDPVMRKSRDRLPDDIVADPRSVPNMLRSLRAAGLKSVVSLAGDPPWERADIQVDLAPGRTGRFDVSGRRVEGEMEWLLKWAGNDSKAGQRHRRVAMRLPQYEVLRATVAERPQRDDAPPIAATRGM